MDSVFRYFPDLTPRQREQFAALGPLYAEWNARINVVSRKDFDQLYLRHVLHSLAIARNTFIDYVRKRQDDLPIDEKFSSPASNTPTPEESVINSQQRHQIELCIARLPENYRRLIRMRFFDEYSYEEIAAKLTLPLGTVKTQIHRAREQMCKLIAQGDER